MKHLHILWNPELQEWFCVKCGRTSDHAVRQDAQTEMELFECEIPTTGPTAFITEMWDGSIRYSL